MKYVSLKYDEASGKIIVDGSSFKGFVDYDAVVGSWWNHNVLDANKQISPISGSVKEQIVNFQGSKNINLYNNNYLVDHYKIKSKKKDLPNNKKLNFDVWINKKNNIIFKKFIKIIYDDIKIFILAKSIRKDRLFERFIS